MAGWVVFVCFSGGGWDERKRFWPTSATTMEGGEVMIELVGWEKVGPLLVRANGSGLGRA